jgi:cellulose synthase/poly-beta-1,6-N-acetylglucosamine synthase-like glycosyltransferase
MSWVGILLFAAAAVLAVPALVLLVQVLAALPSPPRARDSADARPRVAVLVPAHDEAAVIEETLNGISLQLGPGDRVVVVADNCSDDTAGIASRCGAEVLVRNDSRLRGKGYALDHGVRALQADPPEVLVVVDADCQLGPGTIARIATMSRDTGRPVQALYLMRSPPGSGVGRKLAELAWQVKNFVRPLGGSRIGMPCQLMGSGMAFPWASLGAVRLATGHIAEDVLFGIALAKAGTPPLFCVDALVESQFPQSETGVQSQRKRWVHGNLALLRAEVPGLLRAGVARRDPRLFAMALDLAVPPVAMLVMTAGAFVCVTAVAGYAGAGWGGFGLAAGVLAIVVAAVLAAWARYGRGIVSGWQLAFAPVYAVKKVPLYLSFLTRRQTDWVRTRRDG